jgi:hypothetical protein
VVSTTPLPLYTRERPGIHCTGGWVGPRAGLDLCEKGGGKERNKKTRTFLRDGVQSQLEVICEPVLQKHVIYRVLQNISIVNPLTPNV